MKKTFQNHWAGSGLASTQEYIAYKVSVKHTKKKRKERSKVRLTYH